MTTSNIYSLGSSYVYRQYCMSTNELFSLNYTISNQPASRRKSEIRLLSCQRTHYRNLERQKRQNRFRSSSFIGNTRVSVAYYYFYDNIQLYEPLGKAFTVSCAKIPKQWKFARVSAIYKKGNRKLASNYRPVSITSIICRILETIIRDNVVKFLMSNDLLSAYQFGFIEG